MSDELIQNTSNLIKKMDTLDLEKSKMINHMTKDDMIDFSYDIEIDRRGASSKSAINKEVYEETFEILAYIDRPLVKRIPLDVLETIAKRRDKDFKTKIDPKDALNMENVDPKTSKFISWLNLNFFTTTDKRTALEKKYIKAQKEKEIKLKNELNREEEYVSPFRIIGKVYDVNRYSNITPNNTEFHLVKAKERTAYDSFIDFLRWVFLEK